MKTPHKIIVSSALALSLLVVNPSILPNRAEALIGSSVAEASASSSVYQTTHNLNVRTAAGIHNNKVTLAVQGTTVDVIKTQKVGNVTWAYATVNGKSGWMSMDYLALKEKQETNVMAKDCILTGNLFMRSGAGLDFQALTVGAKGATVKVTATKKANGIVWGYTTLNKQSGWMSMNYMVADGKDAVESGKAYKTTGDLYLRSGEGLNHSPLTVAKKGQVVKVQETKKVGSITWAYTTVNGKTGWMSMNYLTLDEKTLATPKPGTSTPVTPKPETSTPVTPKPETSKPETPKPGTTTPVTPKPETSTPVTPKPETPKPETPKPETPKPETPKPETPKPETPKPETPKPETPKPETPKPETPKPETPKPETPKPETPKPETPKPEVPEVEPEPEPEIEEPGDGDGDFMSDAEISAFEYRVLDLVNIERAKLNREPLQMSADIRNTAKLKSEDMALTGILSHHSAKYGSLDDLLNKYGVDKGSMWAENIAVGYATPEAVVIGWMNSDGHRKAIIHPLYTHIGIGFTDIGGTTYWTQHFIGK